MDHPIIERSAVKLRYWLEPACQVASSSGSDSGVLPGGGTVATHAGWRTGLMRRLEGSELNVRIARIAGSDQPLLSASAKHRAFQTTFAAAMDTESHAVAAVATAAGLPLLVVRAVAEPAEAITPAVAFAATGVDGQARSLAVVSHLARRPWETRRPGAIPSTAGWPWKRCDSPRRSARRRSPSIRSEGIRGARPNGLALANSAA
jgi:hypothetical protein